MHKEIADAFLRRQSFFQKPLDFFGKYGRIVEINKYGGVSWLTRLTMTASLVAPARVSAPLAASAKATASTLSTQMSALSAAHAQAFALLAHRSRKTKDIKTEG
jgi:hypothetical protein